MVIGSSPRFSANSALLRLCHLQRVPEVCERVTDLFWRRLERCAASKPHENRISPSWPLKRGNEAAVQKQSGNYLDHGTNTRFPSPRTVEKLSRAEQFSGPPTPNLVGLRGAPWRPQRRPSLRVIEKEPFDNEISNKLPVYRPK